MKNKIKIRKNMQNSFVEIIGYVAGAIVSVSLLPQVVKSWKTKSTKDISIVWNSIYLTGLVLWVGYGFMIDSYPVAFMMSIEAFMALFLLILKLKYK